jgi:hypothetical protein
MNVSLHCTLVKHTFGWLHSFTASVQCQHRNFGVFGHAIENEQWVLVTAVTQLSCLATAVTQAHGVDESLWGGVFLDIELA